MAFLGALRCGQGGLEHLLGFFLREDRERASGGWGRVRVLSFFSISMVSCAAVGVGLLAPEFVALAGLFSGGAYAAAAVVVPILVLGAFIRSYYLVASAVVVGNKKAARWLALATVPAAGLNIVLNSLWTPDYGMTGAAWATVTSYAVAAVATGILARVARKVDFKYGRAALLFMMVSAVLWMGSDLESLLLRIGMICGFGVALLALDGRDIAAALRSLRGGRPQTD